MTLLRDAFDRTLFEPQRARRWRALDAAWTDTPDPVQQRPVFEKSLTSIEN